MFLLSLILLFVLIFILSGNNLSVCTGTAYGSGILSRNGSIALGIAGFIAGFLLEGSMMRSGTHAILLPAGSNAITVLLFVAVILFSAAHYFKIPLSMIMVTAGILIGEYYGYYRILPYAYLLKVVSVWFIVPLIVLLDSLLFYRYIYRHSVRSFNNIWRVASFYKIAILLFSFLFSFVMGANTIGFLYSLLPESNYVKAVVMAALISGPLMMSEGELKRISSGLYMTKYSVGFISLLTSTISIEASTMFSMPISNTQVLITSLFGCAAGEKMKAFKVRGFLTMIASWIITPIAGFVLGYALIGIIT